MVDVVFEAPPPAHLVILRRVKRQAADSSTPDGTENEPPYLENIRANTIGSNNVSVGGSGTNSEHLVRVVFKILYILNYILYLIRI